MTGPSAALRGEAPLAVYIDLKSPYAYLAIDPTRAMARAAGVAIDWRPFTLDIPSYLGSAKLDREGKVAKSRRTPSQWSGGLSAVPCYLVRTRSSWAASTCR